MQLTAVDAPPSHATAFHSAPVVAASLAASSWPALNSTKVASTHPIIVISEAAGIDMENFCKYYAEAMRAKKQ